MGIGWKKDEQPHLNTPEQVVPQGWTDFDLPAESDNYVIASHL